MAKDNISPAAIQEYLGGVDYPASKDDLVEKARSQGADDDVMETLDELPDQDYRSPIDVTKALGDII